MHFKGTLKQFVKKLKKSPQDDDIVYTVREKVKLTDHETGQAFDVEMNLKVKLPAATTTKNGHRQHQVRILLQVQDGSNRMGPQEKENKSIFVIFLHYFVITLIKMIGPNFEEKVSLIEF